jgi:hypothetical protein
MLARLMHRGVIAKTHRDARQCSLCLRSTLSLFFRCFLQLTGGIHATKSGMWTAVTVLGMPRVKANHSTDYRLRAIQPVKERFRNPSGHPEPEL